MEIVKQDNKILFRDGKVAINANCCCECPPGQKCGPECCKADETCCDEQVCCTQEQTCCSGVCCTQEQACCSGSCCDNVCCDEECCEPGQICFDNQCVADVQCPDLCLYRIEVVSPLASGAGPKQSCGGGGASNRDANPPAFDPCGSPAEFSAGVAGDGLFASANTISDSTDEPVYGAAVGVYCAENKLMADISFVVSYPAAFNPGLSSARSVIKTATVELPSSAGVKDNASCASGEKRKSNYLQTPINITVNASSPGIGSWQSVTDTESGDQTEITPCIESLLKNFSATFRITQRDKCCPSGVDCGDECCEPGEACCNSQCCDLSGCNWYMQGCVPVDGTEQGGTLCIQAQNLNAQSDSYAYLNGAYDAGPGSGPGAQVVSQTVYGVSPTGVNFATLPLGVDWKPGYPGALSGCSWALVVDYASSSCTVEIPTDPPQLGGFGEISRRARILVADCDGNVTDVTDQALTAAPVDGAPCYSGVNLARIPFVCNGDPTYDNGCDTPQDPPFLPYFPDPEFICPP